MLPIIKRLQSKISNFRKIFIKAPKNYSRLSKHDVLIYDRSGSDGIVSLLKDCTWHILSLRGEEVYVRALVASIFTRSFWAGRPLESYIDVCIRAVSPRLIVTFIDNDQKFVKISQRWPEITTLFIQNGYRGGPIDLFENITLGKNFHVDYMCCFAEGVGREYSKFIGGKTCVVGSLKNNLAPRLALQPSKEPRKLVFISQLMEPKGDKEDFIKTSLQTISFEDFYWPERMLFPMLFQWCKLMGLEFTVLGRLPKSKNWEADFYRDLVSSNEFDIVYPSNDNCVYTIVDSAKLVVFVDSTLGYESLARGNKTAAFACRGQLAGSDQLGFGWPALNEGKGEFWSNSCDTAEFSRVMDYLNTVSDEEWKKIADKIVPLVIKYDPGNTILNKKISALIHGKTY